MRLHRRRTCALNVRELEGRVLMAAQAPSALWLGQDGHDLVGASVARPNDIQDMHFAVSGLPADRTVVGVNVIGDGGGQWLNNGPGSPGSAAWVQSSGATTADLYIDPYMVETGRKFFINLYYDNGSSDVIYAMGGNADPNLRMPSAHANVLWIGQDGVDLTGPGAGVGPDGIQDVHLVLRNLSARFGLASVTVTTPSGAGWSYGNNVNLLSNAELTTRAGESTTADLYLNPVPGLAGQTLTFTIVYTDGRSDQATLLAGASDPALRMPSTPAIPVSGGTLQATWLGQDGLKLVGNGDVHLSLGGLPVGRSVNSAWLSDGARITWEYQSNRISTIPFSRPLGFQRSTSDPGRAELGFQPVRDESGTNLTLVVVFDDGTVHAVQIAGGSVDLKRLAPEPDSTSIVAKPGDNLVSLVGLYGKIHLTAGTYQVNQPLFLSRAMTITADPGATIVFAQAPGDPGWTTAINIEAGNITLDGFAIRFAGPIRWTTGIDGGPAVIGNAERINGGYKSALVNIRLTHLDLMSPPPSTDWEEATHLIWMTNAQNGVIADNTLRGGTTEFSNGPWLITGNNYQGTPIKTFVQSAFAGHYTHDVLIANNTVQPVGDSGKTWRFLVLTKAGYRDVIRNNHVAGIGPMDNDTVASPNATEVILTEAYQLHYEGLATSISADGWVVQIPVVQGTPIAAGDVVSILSGPEAGQWRLIAQVLNATSFVLASPMSTMNGAISISTGFIQETFQGNTIDARGSSTSNVFILAGNHFGTRVIDNHLLGGGIGLRITTAASESPVRWGWSRSPVLDVLVQGNRLEDNQVGGVFEVEQSSYTKRSKDRTYMTLKLLNNTVVWSDAFVASQLRRGQGMPTTIVVGNSLTNDPTGLWLRTDGNSFEGPASLSTLPTWQIYAALRDGQPALNQSMAFVPAFALGAPADLSLVRDSGLSATDRVTNVSQLRLTPVVGAAGYEYSLSGTEGSFQSIGMSTTFAPEGIAQGTNIVFVRAFDALGRRGPINSIEFVYDTIAPVGVINLVAFADGRVQFEASGTDEFHEYRLGGSGVYVFLGQATSFTSAELLKGPRTVQVHTIDLAGNVGPDSITTVMPRWVSNERVGEDVQDGDQTDFTPPGSSSIENQPVPPAVAVVIPPTSVPRGVPTGPRRLWLARWLEQTRERGRQHLARRPQPRWVGSAGGQSKVTLQPAGRELTRSAAWSQRLRLLQWHRAKENRPG